MRRALRVTATGPLATVQDRGRPGFAHLGVPHSGAADRGAFATANRLVGNPDHAAAIEVTLGGFAARVRGTLVIALAGAHAALRVDGVGVGHAATVVVGDGAHLSVDSASSGVRAYLAIRGGVDVAPVLGSRSTDILSGLGPAVLAEGDVLPVGETRGQWPHATQAFGQVSSGPAPGTTVLRALPGPRADALAEPDELFRGTWVTDSDSNRVGVRLRRAAEAGSGDTPSDAGPALRVRDGSGRVPSEGVALGSVQVPPSGNPTLFLADHPVTGGYPVVAVLTPDSVDRAAQLAPGDRVRLRP